MLSAHTLTALVAQHPGDGLPLGVLLRTGHGDHLPPPPGREHHIPRIDDQLPSGGCERGAPAPRRILAQGELHDRFGPPLPLAFQRPVHAEGGPERGGALPRHGGQRALEHEGREVGLGLGVPDSRPQHGAGRVREAAEGEQWQ